MGTAKDDGEADRPQKWMASLEANLKRATGESLAAWIKIAKKCPPGPCMSQLKWFNDNRSLDQGRAGLILERTFGKKALGARTFDGGSVAPRTGDVALYRIEQFAAMKPSKEGFLIGAHGPRTKPCSG